MDLEPDVEIVLVHGIGRQQQGATLAGFANRFGRSLRARFGAESVTQSATHLRSVPVASTTFALKSPQHDLDHVVRIREAFWAESFHPPKTGAVLRWALVLAPLAVAARGVHLVQYSVWRWWDHPLHWWRIVLAGAFALASWPLAMVLVAVVSASSLLRLLIPVQSVKDLLGQIERTISQVLGDAYLYVVSDADRDAIRTATADVLGSSRGKPLIVVAHSQGTQVAVDAIQATNAPVSTLITLGAAIGQFEWFRRLESRRIGWILVLTPFAFYGSALTLAWAFTQVGHDDYGVTLTYGAGRAFLYGALYLGVAAAMFKFALPSSLFKDSDRQALASVRTWFNVEATADPVSMGQMVGLTYLSPIDVVVVNGNNVLTDHTTYFNNEEVLRLVTERTVTELSDSAWSLQDEQDAALDNARKHAAARHVVASRLVILAFFGVLVARLQPFWSMDANGLWRVARLAPLDAPIHAVTARTPFEIAGADVALGVALAGAGALGYAVCVATERIWRMSTNKGVAETCRLFLVGIDAVLVAAAVVMVQGQGEPVGQLAGVASDALNSLLPGVAMVALASSVRPLRKWLGRHEGLGQALLTVMPWVAATPWSYAASLIAASVWSPATHDVSVASSWIVSGVLFLAILVASGAVLARNKGWRDWPHPSYSISHKPPPATLAKRVGLGVGAGLLMIYAAVALQPLAVFRRFGIVVFAVAVAGSLWMLVRSSRKQERAIAVALAAILVVLVVVDIGDWVHDAKV